MAISAQPDRLVVTLVIENRGDRAATRRRTADGRQLIQASGAVLTNDPVARATAFQALLDIAEENGFSAS